MSDALWPGLLSWIALYCSDYALTIRCARMYHAGVKERFVFEGSYELTPYFQQDVDSLRTLSPRFILALLWSTGMLALVWYLTREASHWLAPYQFCLGALILMELAVHARHVRNLYLFRTVLRTQAVQGRIAYSRSLAIRLSSVELAAFAGIFFVVFLATWSPFVLGGAAMCFSNSVKHWRLARKHPVV